MQDKVCIVVLNWNGWDDTASCLRSLRRLNYGNYEVVVVDNGSTDDSASRIRSEFPWVRLVETGKNLGFAGGCNVGIRYALAEGADFVWLLNNDTTVDCFALQALVDKACGNRRIGAVGSVIYSMANPDQLVAWGGGKVNFWLGRSRHFLAATPDIQIEFLTGASLLLRREVLEAVGLLDEAFFMYWEDADYCFRLRKSGWGLAAAAESRVWHKEQGSVGKKGALLDTYFNRSAKVFFARHSPIPFFSFRAGSALRLAKRAVAGDWERTRAVWTAMTQERTAP